MADTNRVIAAVRSLFEETLSPFDKNGTVVVENDLRDMRIAYTSGQPSCRVRDATCIKFHIHTNSRQMWIEVLRVARSLRSRGIGRQLVAAAEGTASLLGVHTVSVFPYESARGFWVKMGYAPHRKMARVVTKDLDEGEVSLCQKPRKRK